MFNIIFLISNDEKQWVYLGRLLSIQSTNLNQAKAPREELEIAEQH